MRVRVCVGLSYLTFTILIPLFPCRNPYVDVLNVLQVEALRRLRKGDILRTSKGNARMDVSKTLTEDALLVTINGIVAGMRNSG